MAHLIPDLVTLAGSEEKVRDWCVAEIKTCKGDWSNKVVKENYEESFGHFMFEKFVALKDPFLFHLL